MALSLTDVPWHLEHSGTSTATGIDKISASSKLFTEALTLPHTAWPQPFPVTLESGFMITQSCMFMLTISVRFDYFAELYLSPICNLAVLNHSCNFLDDESAILLFLGNCFQEKKNSVMFLVKLLSPSI